MRMEIKLLKLRKNLIYKKVNEDYYITLPFKELLLEGLSSKIFEYVLNGFDMENIIQDLHEKYSVEKGVIKLDVTEFINRLISLRILYNEEYSTKDKYMENYTNINLINKQPIDIYEKAHKNNIPLNIDFHVTYNCNLKCKHCYAEDRKNTYSNNNGMSLNQIKIIFDQLAEAGTFFLRISGGEPFIHPNIMDILAYGREKGFSISVITNGTLLTKNIILKLSTLPLRDLTFSIHGATSETHDKFVGQQGSLDKLKKNLIMCKNLGIPVKLTWTLTEDSIGEAADVLKFSKDHNVPLTISPRIVPQMDGNISPKKYRVSNSELIKFIEKFDYKPIPLKCTAGSKIQINYDGSVQPCLFINDILGDLKIESFKNIWNKLVQIRELKYKTYLETPYKCTICKYRSNCHRCPGVAYIETGKASDCSETALWEASAYYRTKVSEEV